MSNNRPSDWSSRRKKVLERDGYKCANCGEPDNRNLEVHHIVPLKDGGSNKLSNLKTLCLDCHSAIHNKTKTAGQGNAKSKTPRIPELDECLNCSGRSWKGVRGEKHKFCTNCYTHHRYRRGWIMSGCLNCLGSGADIEWGEHGSMGRCMNCREELTFHPEEGVQVFE